MKKTLGVLVIVLTFSAGNVHAGECDRPGNKTYNYDNADSQVVALKMARICSAQYLSAAFAVLKVQIEVEKELKQEPQSLPLIRLKAKIVLAQNRYTALADSFEEKAKKIEKDIVRDSIMVPGGVFRKLPKNTVM